MVGILIQLIVSGIAMGVIYALVGIEYTLIWNASGVLNFSHDKLITLGAYIFGGTYIIGLGMGYVPGIILSLITVALIGLVIARLIFIPLRNMTMIYTIMATVMLGKIIIEFIRLFWGPVPFSVPGFLVGTVKVGGIVISIANIAIIVVAAVCVGALQLFLYKTKPGKAMRCVAQNRNASQLMGIDVKYVMMIMVQSGLLQLLHGRYIFAAYVQMMLSVRNLLIIYTIHYRIRELKLFMMTERQDREQCLQMRTF